MFIANKLKILRENKGYSVEKLFVELSNAGLDIACSTYRNWENGVNEPNAGNLEIIAKYYKKPLGFFFG